MKEFEDMTIGELRKLNEEFKGNNKNVQTAQEILDEKFDEKENKKE
jgi:hypothetical protein